MNFSQWYYCKCGWQAKGPSQGPSICPECKSEAKQVGGSTAQMDLFRNYIAEGKNLSQVVK